MPKQRIIVVTPRTKEFPPRKEISYKLAQRSANSSIIGAYASIILTIVIFLYTCGTATKVEGMKDLVLKQDTAMHKQDSIIRVLTRQSTSQIETNKHLKSMQDLANDNSTNLNKQLASLNNLVKGTNMIVDFSGQQLTIARLSAQRDVLQEQLNLSYDKRLLCLSFGRANSAGGYFKEYFRGNPPRLDTAQWINKTTSLIYEMYGEFKSQLGNKALLIDSVLKSKWDIAYNRLETLINTIRTSSHVNFIQPYIDDELNDIFMKDMADIQVFYIKCN